MRNLEGKTALVTGASSGIGYYFCKELASRGCDILAVSNQKEALEECVNNLIKDYGVNAYAFYADLTKEADIRALLEYVDLQTSPIDFLINNAGIFSFKPLIDTTVRKIDTFISLHVAAVTILSREFALRFKERGKGRILNMSSMSCWAPMPGLAMYSATKAYIRVFSRALHYEMKDYGVSVTVACPGGIATDLFGLPENLKKLALAIGALDSPERFARKAVDKMLKGKQQYINGLLNRLSIVAVGLTPTCLRMQIKRKMLDKGIAR